MAWSRTIEHHVMRATRKQLLDTLYSPDSMYLADHKEGVTVRVRVIPRSSMNVITGIAGDCLGVKLTSPPVGGRANRDLVKLIGKKLKIAPSSITILRGQSSREKVLLISGMKRELVHERLADPGKR